MRHQQESGQLEVCCFYKMSYSSSAWPPATFLHQALNAGLPDPIVLKPESLIKKSIYMPRENLPNSQSRAY